MQVKQTEERKTKGFINKVKVLQSFYFACFCWGNVSSPSNYSCHFSEKVSCYIHRLILSLGTAHRYVQKPRLAFFGGTLKYINSLPTAVPAVCKLHTVTLQN